MNVPDANGCNLDDCLEKLEVIKPIILGLSLKQVAVPEREMQLKIYIVEFC